MSHVKVGGEMIDFRQLWEDAKANQERLKTCSRHDFSIDLRPDTLNKLWRCTNCGGEVRHLHRYWYNLGLEHGKIDGKLEGK